MRTLFIFVDGLGIGTAGPHNPLYTMQLPGLARLAGGGPLALLALGEVRLGPEAGVKALDACFGVPGLPQSATGQVSLLCGKKAPVLVGGHVNAYPTTDLRRIIAEGSLLSSIKHSGGKVTFLNGYRDLDASGQPQGRRLSATSLVTMGAGVVFRSRSMIATGQALTHDITGEHLAAMGHDVMVVSVEAAARAALDVAMAHDLTLFECFLTDVAGHGKRTVAAGAILSTLDTFVSLLLSWADARQLSVALSSDHGNIEDLSVGTHTTNPVPFALWGGPEQERNRMICRATDIGDIASCLETWIRRC